VVHNGEGAEGDGRRDDMLRAALEVIAERGFADTRIADVAERAGTSPALVIYYFQTKDNLLTEAVRLVEDLWYEYGFRRMDGIVGSAARLEVMVTTGFVPPEDIGIPSLWALWVDLWARALRDPNAARVREDFDARWRRVVADLVREGQVTGEFGDIEPDDFVLALSAMLDGLSVQIALADPVVDARVARRLAMRFASEQLGFAWSFDEILVAPSRA
jgi:AcrR family transcriptional regulator